MQKIGASKYVKTILDSEKEQAHHFAQHICEGQLYKYVINRN